MTAATKIDKVAKRARPTELAMMAMTGTRSLYAGMLTGMFATLVYAFVAGFAFPWAVFAATLVLLTIVAVYTLAIYICSFVIALRIEDGYYPKQEP